jgi:hypothetical protein
MGAGQLSNVGEPKYREPEVVKIGNNTPPKTPPGMVVAPIPPDTTWLDLRNREYSEFTITVDQDFFITLVNANEGARLKLFVHRTQDTRIFAILNPWENRVSIPGKSDNVFILDVECIKKPDASYLYPQIVNPIDDEGESDYKTFSSKKIIEKALQAAGDLIDDAVSALDSVWSSTYIQKKITAIYSTINGIINDSLSTGTKNTYSISKIKNLLTGYLPVSSGKTITVNTLKADTGDLKIELNGNLKRSQTICIERSDGNRAAVILKYDSGNGKWQIGGTIDATNLQKRGKDLATQEAINLQFISERELSEYNYPRKNAVTTFAEDVYFAKNIFQQGDSYETHAEQVITKNDFIIMRDGSIGGLGSSLSGFKILKANGVVNLIMGAGADAIARVGWEGKQLQAIATREDRPFRNGLSFWNDSLKRFDTANFSYTELLRKSQNENVSGIYDFVNGLKEGGKSLSIKYLGKNETATNSNSLGGVGSIYYLRTNVSKSISGRLTFNSPTWDNHIRIQRYADGQFTILSMFRQNKKDGLSIKVGGLSYAGINLIATGGSNSWNHLGINKFPTQALDVSGNIVATGTITNGSDRRLKSNIMPLSSRGELNPVSYMKNGMHDIGFIAQEVRELYPELVFGQETEDEYLTLNYSQLTAVLCAEINEIKRQVKDLTEQIAQR